MLIPYKIQAYNAGHHYSVGTGKRYSLSNVFKDDTFEKFRKRFEAEDSVDRNSYLITSINDCKIEKIYKLSD